MRACWTAAKRSLPPRPTQRALSSKVLGKLPAIQHLHPSIRDFALELGQTQPCFALQPRDICILSQPKDFLDSLLDMIRRARKRIFISSLYIGSAEDYLITALEESLRANPGLHVHLHLDYNRSTRPGPASTASLLTPLIKEYPDRVHAHFFKSPKLKGLMAKLVPRRFDEGWGTWHAKVYGADDEVLISGANLNDSYFTNRQDRYLHFKSPLLSNYCYSFLKTMTPFSYQLESGSPYAMSWPSNSLHPEHIEDEAGKALQTFQDHELRGSLTKLEESQNNDEIVLLFPIIQAGQFGIREEEECIDLLFKHLDQHSASTGTKPLIDFTSGYFSLAEPYQKLLQQSHADCRLLCASPLANGFFGSSGVSGRIPEGYTFLEQRFWRGVLRAGRAWKDGHGIQLHEWEKNNWTYHAKGLWVSPISTSNATAELEPPVLTLFGSTNLNSRSANLDIELAFVMVVPSSDGEDTRNLREQLREEVNGLRRHAVPWRGEERKVRPGTKALVKVVGGML
ncbi:CDP-diacylglycerol-glycerol-3-phosphate 3-phosphatidyltransferase [Fomitiporia mediterranea MF3/22]|uniref:CDP-diacylglycerol-glycerol-3-phosphate 3-phosphatidyltransferase n=1 Tax=Fomitiporia mediterranea (strain MF3/22) TaxID=694068 RepID=UPI0004407D51|nr:CDP-diacylglycerol-glycerol-3-phosphate 3-phosphatidyltransferase [Fomitiporia mediterranea MF3/22]EJD02180.1 CDP-diacylglycerol-glycerol-3-phosphate 3-phosphatidyltransferase [Fomitiporia mediterranea MF3/22]